MREENISEIKKISEDLANDLDLLFEIFKDGEKLERVKKAIEDTSVAPEEFFKRVPWEFVRLSSVLVNEPLYKDLTNDFSDHVKLVFEEARKLVLENLAGLQMHPAVLERVRKMISDEDGVKESEPLNLNAIRNIFPMSLLIPKDENKYLPAVRIGFRDRKKNLLLDTTLDWDDLLFISSSLLGIFCKEVENHKALAEQNKLALDDNIGIGKKLFSIQESFNRVKENLDVYNIVIGKDEPEAPNKTVEIGKNRRT